MEDIKFAFTRREAAKAASTSLTTIDEWLRRRDCLPHFRVGKKVFIPLDAFRDFLNRQAGYNNDRAV